MAEFDTSGFSAVESFFGGRDDTEASQPVAKTALTPTTKRGGVGAVVKKASDHVDIAKRLLRVGKKRRGDDDGDESDLEEKSEADEGDGEDTGRTGISAKEKAQETNSQVILEEATGAGNKKKLGKKERQRLKEEKSALKSNVDEGTGNAEESKVAETEDTGNKKQKRRKIRSKQKNIRKDNRENKPDHLVPGQKRYQGRPLTMATRNKLNLPAPKPKPFFHSASVNEESGPTEDEGVRLAIDDLLVDSGTTTTSKRKSKQSSKPKKKKRKYKNL